MSSNTAARALAILLVAALVAGACGGDDSGEDAQPGEDDATTTSTDTTEADAAGVVINETFDDDSNEWIGDPAQYEGQGVIPAIDQGALTFGGTDPDAVLDMWPTAIEDQAPTLADQRVEVTVSFTSPAGAHVFCRLDPTANGPTFYVVTVASGGFYTVQKVVDGALEGGDFLASTPAEFKEQSDSGVPAADATLTPAFAPDPEALHDIAVECTGGEDGTPVTISVSDGGTEVLSVDDADTPLLTGIGGVGVEASRFLVARDGFENYGMVADDFLLTDLAGAG